MSFVHDTGQLVSFLTSCVGWAQHYSWYVIYTKWPFVIVSTIVGFLALNVRRYYPDERRRKHPDELTAWDRLHDRFPVLDRIPVRLAWRPIRSVAGALAGLSISSGLVTLSILLHAADPYWLPAGTEKASHLAPPRIGVPSVTAPSHVPLVGGALQALANALTGSLQHVVDGTNAALGGVTNAGNAVIDMGLRIRAATIAGQVAFQFGVLWLASTFLLAIICSIALGLFIARTANKLFVVWNKVEELARRLWAYAQAIQELRRQNRELMQTVNYMAEILRHNNIWPAGQPLPQLFEAAGVPWPDDRNTQPTYSDSGKQGYDDEGYTDPGHGILPGSWQ